MSKKKTNDKKVVEKAIDDFNEHLNRLEEIEEIDDYHKGVNMAIFQLKGSIANRINYLQDVLSWYDEESHVCGTNEVIDSYEGIIWVFLGLLEESEDTPFDKGAKDTYQKSLFQFARELSCLDETNEKAQKTFLYLFENGFSAEV